MILSSGLPLTVLISPMPLRMPLLLIRPYLKANYPLEFMAALLTGGNIQQ